MERPAETERSQKRVYDRTILKPFGGVGPEEPKGEAGMDLRTRRWERKAGRMIRVGTWNVRTLSKGKLENVKREMVRNRVNVMGLSEVRWTGAGVIESEEVKMYYSGGEERQRGVAVVLDKEAARRVSKVTQDSDRVIMVRIEAEPVDLVVIQVYMPTTEHEDEEVEQIYEKVEGIIKH